MAESQKQSRIIEQWPWIKGYSGSTFTDDVVAAIIVTILLVPQCLAYALLAGLPPQVGIYASILPLIAYVAFGSSRHMSVGPTAVISLMTAAAIATLPEESRLVSAAVLAVMSGSMLIVFGVLKGGFTMNFVSRSVVTAYITGAALLIMISQTKHIFGISSSGTTAFAMIKSLAGGMSSINSAALLVGSICIALFWTSKKYLGYAFVKMGLRSRHAKLLSRMAPILVIAASIALSYYLKLPERYGLKIIGEIPRGLPTLKAPVPDLEMLRLLWLPALVLGLVAFVDNMSTAQTLASRSRDRINADREMLGMGAANLIAGVSGGYPVNGSMSRSAVNYTAGAKTPVSSLVVAALMTLSALFLTPILKYLPLATLAALIIAACFSLFDFKSLWRTWKYSSGDGFTALATFLGVLIFGVQWGVLIGVIMAMILHIRTTLRPHMAIVGRFPGTEHYRDEKRFNVETNPMVKTLRIDESLYYANARYLEDKIARLVEDSPQMTDLVLMCPAINRIDASALSSLETINSRLKSAEVNLHFSELHSHVKDRLVKSNLIKNLTGEVYFTQQEAMEALEPEPDWSRFSDHIDIH